MTLTGADWQLLESIIVVLPKKKIKKVCKHTDATKKAIKQVRKGQSFVREWDPKVAFQTLQYLEKHVYKKDLAKTPLDLQLLRDDQRFESGNL